MKKKHKRWSSDDVYGTWCGLRTGYAEAVDRWQYVTCKNCLKQRPRRR